jgi:hypothetical protein
VARCHRPHEEKARCRPPKKKPPRRRRTLPTRRRRKPPTPRRPRRTQRQHSATREKAARDAQAKLDALEAEKLSDVEKLEKRATDAEAKVSAATDKLRKANLLTALSASGVAHPKAAVRLLDGVEFDDSDEPKNLDAAITAAKTEYGEDMFKGSKPAPPGNVNGGGNEHEDAPPLDADELAMAKSFGMTPEQYQAAKSPSYQPPAPVKT